MLGAMERLALLVAVLFALSCSSDALTTNDRVNGTLNPCSVDEYELSTSSSPAAGSIQYIDVESDGEVVVVLQAQNRLYTQCEEGTSCSITLTCGLFKHSEWTLLISGSNGEPVPYTITTSQVSASVVALTSGKPVEQKDVPFNPAAVETRYMFYSVSASNFSTLASLNVSVDPGHAASHILARQGSVPTFEDADCVEYATSKGELLVSSCSLEEGVWYVAVEPARDEVSYMIEATVGKDAVEALPLNMETNSHDGLQLYSLLNVGDVAYFKVDLDTPTGTALDHTLNMTVLHVQGGVVEAQLTLSDALPYSGCETPMAACAGAFACTDYVRPCKVQELYTDGEEHVYVGVRVVSKDNAGAPVRFSVVVALNDVEDAVELEVDEPLATAFVLQNEIQYYDFHVDDEDDETYVNVYLYGDSLTLAGVSLLVGADRFDDDGCILYQKSCSVLGATEVGSCGIQLSPCDLQKNRHYFVTVVGGPLADAYQGFPYTLLVDKRKPLEMEHDALVLDMVVMDEGYEHFEVDLDDEESLLVTIGNVMHGTVDVFLWSHADGMAGDVCSSGQCYNSDTPDGPYRTFNSSGGSFIMRHCSCNEPRWMSVRANARVNSDRPVSFTLSAAPTGEEDVNMPDLNEDESVTALLGGNIDHVQYAYYEVDAGFDDNDEVAITLLANDFLAPGPSEMVEMTYFAGSGQNVFCESCAEAHSCLLGGSIFCTIVFQPCEYDIDLLERSHVRVGVRTEAPIQFLLSLDVRSIDVETVSPGVPEVSWVGVDQYRHFRIRYPGGQDDDDDHDYDSEPTRSLLVELYLDQASDTKASLFINEEEPAGERLECFNSVTSRRSAESILRGFGQHCYSDLTLDACYVDREATYYISVRGETASARNRIPFTLTARWVAEYVELEANVPLSIAMFPSQRVLHTFKVNWPSSSASGMNAQVILSTVDDVVLYASLGVPDTAHPRNVSSCCFDVFRRDVVAASAEVAVPVRRCDGSDFMLLVQAQGGRAVRYVIMLVVDSVERAQPIEIGSAIDDDVPSHQYNFYSVDVGEGESGRVSVHFSNIRGGTVRTYVGQDLPPSQSSCDAVELPCMPVHGTDDQCVLFMAGCETGVVPFFSVYGESEDGGDVFYTVEITDHDLITLHEGERMDRVVVLSADPVQFVADIPSPSSSFQVPTVKVIISDISDVSSGDVLTVALGDDLCLFPHELQCESTAACVLYLPSCEFRPGDYYVTVTANGADVEFDIEIDLVDVETAGVLPLRDDDPVAVEIQAHNYQVFEITSSIGLLETVTVSVQATDSRDEISATLDTDVVVEGCSPRSSCGPGNLCLITLKTCCVSQIDALYLTVYNAQSTQFEITAELHHASDSFVDEIELPYTATKEQIAGQSTQFVFVIDEELPTGASLNVDVSFQGNPTAQGVLRLQENGLAGSNDGTGPLVPCEGGSILSTEFVGGAASFQYFRCNGLRQSMYAVQVATDPNNPVSEETYNVTISVQTPAVLSLDDPVALDLSSVPNGFVQYQLDLSGVASPFSDLVISIANVTGSGAVSAALNFNSPATDSPAFLVCAGHLPNSGDSAGSCVATSDSPCVLRSSVCGFTGTYFLGIQRMGEVSSVVVSPGFEELQVQVDVISTAPRNVTADEENLQLFRTQNPITLSDETYFEMEIRTKDMSDVTVMAAWGNSCPVQAAFHCDTDSPESCYFRLFACEIEPDTTVFFSVRTHTQYSISYTIRRPTPTPIEIGDSVSGSFVGVAEPQYYVFDLNSGAVAAGSSVVIEVVGECGEVTMDVNAGSLAGGACVIGSGNVVELEGCSVVQGSGEVSIQLEASESAFKDFEVPVRYTLTVSSSESAGLVSSVTPLLANSISKIRSVDSAFMYSIDSLTLYAGTTTVSLELPLGVAGVGGLSYSFDSAIGCGDMLDGCSVSGTSCSFSFDSCALSQQSMMFIVPTRGTPRNSLVSIERTNPSVRLIDASNIDWTAPFNDDDDDDHENPSSFVVHGSVSPGHAEYFHVVQDPWEALHLLNATVVVEPGAGGAVLLADLDRIPSSECSENLCTTVFDPEAPTHDGLARCSLFYGQRSRDVYLAVEHDGDGDALVEYTLRIHFGVPLRRSLSLDPFEAVCALVEPHSALYAIADFDMSSVAASKTAFTRIVVATVMEHVALTVTMNSDTCAWPASDEAEVQLTCFAGEPCDLLFQCPVLHNVTLSITASGAVHPVPVTVLWSEVEEDVKQLQPGVVEQRGRYFQLNYPKVDADEVVEVVFHGADNQRLFFDDARVPGEDSVCHTGECTDGCSFLCFDYSFNQTIFFVVTNALSGEFELSYRIAKAFEPTTLPFNSPQVMSLSTDETVVFELDVGDVAEYTNINVLTYGMPSFGNVSVGELSLWANVDEPSERDCAVAFSHTVGNGALLPLRWCDVQDASKLYVSFTVTKQASQCDDVSFSVVATLDEPEDIAELKQNTVSSVQMKASNDVKWFSFTVEGDLTADSLLDFTLEGVTSSSVAATLFLPSSAATAHGCRCSLPFKSESLMVPPCCTVKGTYYVEVIHLNPPLSTASYDLVASVVEPVVLETATPVDVSGEDSGRAQYFVASGDDDDDSVSISYSSDSDAAYLSVWMGCEEASVPVMCALGTCSVTFSWKETRPAPTKMYVQVGPGGSASEGQVEWRSGRNNCIGTKPNAFCSISDDVWVGPEQENTRIALDDAAKLRYEEVFDRLFCMSGCTCEFVSRECTKALKAYVCAVSLPTCGGAGGWRTRPCHKLCHDVERRCGVHLDVLAPELACSHEWLDSCGETTPPSPPSSSSSPSISHTPTPSTPSTTSGSSAPSESSHDGFGTTPAASHHTLEWVIFSVFTFFFLLLLLAAAGAGMLVFVRKRRRGPAQSYAPLEVNYE